MLLRNKNKTKRGFTLVELILVISIIGIMTGVVLAIGSKSGAAQDAEAMAQQVAAQIRTLQNEALTGKKVNDAGVYKNACEFVFANTANSYSISYNNCSGTLIGNATTVDVQRKKVQFDAVRTAIFQSPRGDLKGGVTVDIIISSKKDNSIKRVIRIYNTGNVTISNS